MAEKHSVASSTGSGHAQTPQTIPAVTSSESPGKKKPINRPVSTKTITLSATIAAP